MRRAPFPSNYREYPPPPLAPGPHISKWFWFYFIFTEGHPTIEIAPSTYGSDLGQLITDTAYADVRFLFQDGHPPLHAHKIVLCSSSCVFRTLFMAAKDNAEVEVSEMFEDISCQCLPPRNSKKILQKHICTTKSVITVNYSVSGT